jgi:hypothetical protein
MKAALFAEPWTRADEYATAARPDLRVREDELFQLPPVGSELEIQARWFAGDYGLEFETADSEPVRIVQFGIWNREAGPDFVDAAVEIGGRKLHGAIEIDVEDRDWERHGHATNPSFENVVLHVVVHCGGARFFTRTANGRNVPQVHLPGLSTKPFSMPALAKPGRCVAPLAKLDKAAARNLLETAAYYRLQRKGSRLARFARVHGPDEALFMGVAEALGYRENKIPFLLLAERLTLRHLRKQPAEAVLLGVSGFLERSSRDGGAETYLRSLWEQWWPVRASLDRFLLPPASWRLGAARPANHPQRRLAALALVAQRWNEFRVAAQPGRPAQIFDFFESLGHDFWETHATLTSRPLARPVAIVGRDRAREILLNVVGPAALQNDPGVLLSLCDVPSGPPSRKVTIARRRLFGENQSLAEEIVRSAVAEQGLLQIYEDFCQRDATDCAACPFPGVAAGWH